MYTYTEFNVYVILTTEPLSENQAPKIIFHPQKKYKTQIAENLAIHFALKFRFWTPLCSADKQNSHKHKHTRTSHPHWYLMPRTARQYKVTKITQFMSENDWNFITWCSRVSNFHPKPHTQTQTYIHNINGYAALEYRLHLSDILYGCRFCPISHHFTLFNLHTSLQYHTAYTHTRTFWFY